MIENNINPIAFEMPKHKSNAIKVIGVGGGGSNAVNYMYQQDISGVDFIICNTDAQALDNSPIPNKIQIGSEITEGLGAGANPEKGAKAAEESYDVVLEALSHETKMVFITAGMGGGTGTGAAPIIAKAAKELSLLTVGIVTMPFEFEGKSRIEQAKKGIEKLREYVDSLIIINNNKLREVYGNLGYKSGFAKADEVLSTAAQGIAEVITHHYKHNIDLNDAKTVLSNSGTAIMGSALAQGDDRAVKAITNALDSPLLNDNKITGAKNVLLLIVSGTKEVTIDEIGEINDHIHQEAGHDVNIIMGVGDDETLGDAIAVTIIATGFSCGQQQKITNTEVKKIIHTLEDNQELEINFEEYADHNKTSATPFDDTDNDDVEQIIIHNLEQEESKTPESELIPTTDDIKNIEVLYDDINVSSYTEHDFIVHEVNEDIETKPEKPSKQMSLVFEFPEEGLSSDSRDKTIETIETHEAIDVTDEVVRETTYVLEDDTEEQYSVKKTKQKTPDLFTAEDEMFQFEVKTKEEPQTPQPSGQLQYDNLTAGEEEALSPLNMSIEQFKRTTDQRKQNLRQHNYKFKHEIHNVDEYEKEPAYKRMNVELSDHEHASQTNHSRTSVSGNKDDIKLRTNNSYLHDNVD